MVKIYVKNANGQKVYVEVTDEQAKVYRDECRKEWRNMANEKNHTVSLDEIVDAGHDIADEQSDIESIFEEKENKANTKALIRKLKDAMSELTPTQKRTIYKLFVKNMTQAEIAKEEGLSKAAITYRVNGIYSRLKKLLEKK